MGNTAELVREDETPTVDRTVDLDSHEMVPPHLRAEVFGPTRLQAISEKLVLANLNSPNAAKKHVLADDTPINYDTVWNLKGASAPSAVDLNRRPEVMDVMGIDSQLCYPTFGLAALLMAMDPNAHKRFRVDPSEVDCREVGLEAIDAHNSWASRMTKSTGSRVRPVGIVMTESVDAMIRRTEQMITDGIRAIMLPANVPPAGTSPADPVLDPFWKLCAEANLPVTIHLGTERGFLSTDAWSNGVGVFQPSFNSTIEFVIEPLVCVTLHYAPENFVSAMVMGGVFERHPTLRLGVVELSASWVGPLAERMDMWANEMFAKRFASVLSMKPSAYLARNVRVTPFFFEPIEMYFQRYPHLSDVFAYSTDYPHFEGGADSKVLYARKLAGFSSELRDKFFYQNGKLILPD